MKNIYLVLLFYILISACGGVSDNGNQHIVIETGRGDIEIELYPKQAPQTVAAFLKYIDSGYFDKAVFYRVLTDDNQPSNAPKSELIQGGIWKTNYKLVHALPGIPHESTKQTGILHKDGTISLARAEPGTANTEFFICVGDQPGFDYGGANNADGLGYAAFGKVIKGMDAVKSIYNSPETDQYLDPPVAIFAIKRK